METMSREEEGGQVAADEAWDYAWTSATGLANLL